MELTLEFQSGPFSMTKLKFQSLEEINKFLLDNPELCHKNALDVSGPGVYRRYVQFKQV